MKRPARGFSLVELAVTVAIFGMLLLVLVSLEAQFIRFDRSMRIQFLRHPETEAVLARVRRDVLDSTSYPDSYESFTQSPTTLIVTRMEPPDHPLTIVYQFTADHARRMVFRDDAPLSTWEARGLPAYTVVSFEMPDGTTAVRLQAHDAEGRPVVDQILAPRVHS